MQSRSLASCDPRRRSRWFQASFGAVNIVVLVAANAAGFCFGGEGLRMLLGSLFTAAGIR